MPGERSAYLWSSPACRGCDAVGELITANGLAFIVRCTQCGCQTGMERCAQDAMDAWRKVNEP